MNFGAESKEIKDQMQLLFSHILMEQQKIDGLKKSDPGKKHLIDGILEEYEKCKGRGFFFPYISSGKGHGPFTELVDGSVKYDLISAIGPNLLGHSHPLYIKGMLEAATVDSIMCGNLLTYKEAFLLTQSLLETVKNSRLKHFWFSGSGSFSNDTAFKIIWQKTAPKYKILAFENSFAGRSVATQEVTYNKSYREGMPSYMEIEHVPHYNVLDPENSLKITLNALSKAYEKDGSNISMLMIELIQGEAGFVFGPKEYYEAIFKWAKEKNLYILVDEVQSFARTTELFAFQMFGLDQYVDVVTVGKALQSCGTFFTDELNPKPGLIAGTFNGAIGPLNVGNKIIKYLMEGHFYGENGRIKKLEETFLSRLRHLKNNSCKGKIGYVGGTGTMISFEVGDASKDITSNFVKKLFEEGIISFIAGNKPARVRFLLPLSLTEEHIDEILKILETVILETIN